MKLIILGAGGYGRVIADIAAQLGKYSEIFFLDDGSKDRDVLGKCEDYMNFADADTEFYPAFGNNEMRMKWLDELMKNRLNAPTLVHPTAYVSPTAKIGVGTVILPKAAVGSHSMVGRGVLINMGAMIDHNCILADGCHICLGALVKADNHIPPMLKIEAGQVIENRTYRSENDGN